MAITTALRGGRTFAKNLKKCRLKKEKNSGETAEAELTLGEKNQVKKNIKKVPPEVSRKQAEFQKIFNLESLISNLLINMDILIFKTNVIKDEHISDVMPHLNSMGGILKWNFDLDDCDKILRVESVDLSPREIEQKLLDADYFCEELVD